MFLKKTNNSPNYLIKKKAIVVILHHFVNNQSLVRRNWALIIISLLVDIPLSVVVNRIHSIVSVNSINHVDVVIKMNFVLVLKHRYYNKDKYIFNIDYEI
jgi:hypothetical protein